ncbi:MAG: hypothetical protein K2Q09_09935, partial [Phycisphaerales bacterium]|nr:hypothetical protein [Phycisphaerales bacterium]
MSPEFSSRLQSSVPASDAPSDRGQLRAALEASAGGDLAGLIDAKVDRGAFGHVHWSGTFFDYLEVVERNPGVVRNAYQRAYDAVMSQGMERYRVFKKDAIRYHFFSDPFEA